MSDGSPRNPLVQHTLPRNRLVQPMRTQYKRNINATKAPDRIGSERIGI